MAFVAFVMYERTLVRWGRANGSEGPALADWPIDMAVALLSGTFHLLSRCEGTHTSARGLRCLRVKALWRSIHGVSPSLCPKWRKCWSLTWTRSTSNAGVVPSGHHVSCLVMQIRWSSLAGHYLGDPPAHLALVSVNCFGAAGWIRIKSSWETVQGCIVKGIVALYRVGCLAHSSFWEGHYAVEYERLFQTWAWPRSFWRR